MRRTIGANLLLRKRFIKYAYVRKCVNHESEALIRFSTYARVLYKAPMAEHIGVTVQGPTMNHRFMAYTDSCSSYQDKRAKLFSLSA